MFLQGVLPVDLLNTDSNVQVEYLLSNAIQINTAFSTVRKQIEEQSFELFYASYEPLSTNTQDAYLQNITTLIKQSKTDESVNQFYLFY